MSRDPIEQALLQRMGTTRSYITRLFQGSANLSVKSMTRLAAALGCSVRVQIENPQDARPLVSLDEES